MDALTSLSNPVDNSDPNGTLQEMEDGGDHEDQTLDNLLTLDPSKSSSSTSSNALNS